LADRWESEFRDLAAASEKLVQAVKALSESVTQARLALAQSTLTGIRVYVQRSVEERTRAQAAREEAWIILHGHEIPDDLW
jgi:hypothetical protein